MWICPHCHLSAVLSPSKLATIDAKTSLWQPVGNLGQNNFGSISLLNTPMAPGNPNRTPLLENIQACEVLFAQILPF